MPYEADKYQLAYDTFNRSEVPSIWTDLSGRVLHINPAASRLFHLSPDTKGVKIYQLFPDETSQSWDRHWKNLQEDQVVRLSKILGNRGNTMDLQITLKKIAVNDQHYAVCEIYDKTHEQLLRDEITESQRRLSTLLDNLPGMAYRCLLDEHWTMEFVSRGCRELTGHEPEEIIQNNKVAYKDLIDPMDRDPVWNSVLEGIRKHKAFQVKYRIRTAGGERKWVWEQGVGIFRDPDELIAIEGFITDITEIKLAEHELIKKEEMVRELKDKLQEEAIYLKEEIKLQSNFEEIITKSIAFRSVLKSIEKVASTDSTVLILGETGTGKELIARAIHNNSPRSQRALIKVNCAALVPELIESELFGHEKGAFTGAYTERQGRFELAHEGTIFLDEIGELPAALQVKLLRVIQEGEFERLGSTETIQTDVRIIAATNRDLEEAVAKGDFRRDLYFRLNVFPLYLPPLRERKEDIPLLVNHFIRIFSRKTGKEITGISEGVIQHLTNYSWPGNVRELENIIERAVILSSGKRLVPGSWMPGDKKDTSGRIQTLKENEKYHILKALEATHWKVSGENGAARVLGMNRTTLEARMKKLGISRPS